MKRIVTRTMSVLIPMMALMLLALPAHASFDWCKTDPIVRLNGVTVQILVAIPEQYVPLVDGAIDVEIATPKGTTRELLFTDAGYNGHGETVEFKNLDGGGTQKGTFPVEIDVELPVDESGLGDDEEVPVQVEVIVDGGAPIVVEGTSDGTQVRLRVPNR